jgi:formate dehydrogenase maturation protein FdhE
MENPVVKEMGLDLGDMASLPLDIVAQEKGYTRAAPNPIGLKKMV